MQILTSKFDQYFWSSKHISPAIVSSALNPKLTTILVSTRIFSFVWSSVCTIWFIQALWPNYFIFLSYWGMFSTTVYFTLQFCNLVFCNIISKNIILKLIYFLFELSWTLEALIVPVFWIDLYPEGKYHLWKDCITHVSFLVLLMVDYVFNGIVFMKSHFLLILGIEAAYLLINITVTFQRNKPIYQHLKFTDAWSFLYIAGCLLVTAGGFYIGMFFDSRCKHLRSKKLDAVQSDAEDCLLSESAKTLL